MLLQCIYLGNVIVEQASATKPSLPNGVTNVDWSDAYTTSTNPSIVTATPIASPLTPTTTIQHQCKERY